MAGGGRKQICWWVGHGVSEEGESGMAPQGLRAMGGPGERCVSGREKEYAGCLQSGKPVCYYRTHWPVILCCLLSGITETPLETLAAALTYQFSVGKETGVSLSLPPICPSVHPFIIRLLS